MKKTLSIILLLCLILGIFTSCKQEKGFDSVNLPEQVYADLNLPEDAFVIRISYDREITEISNRKYDIKNDFDEANYTQGTYYSLLSDENSMGRFCQYDKEGNMVSLELNSPDGCYDDFFEYARHPEKVLGYFTRVKNIYCCMYSWWEQWIYYEMDNGTDYILLREYDLDEKIYLFSVEEIKPMLGSLKSKRDTIFGRFEQEKYKLSDVEDISEYEIIPKSMTKREFTGVLVSSISICVLTALIVGAFVIVAKKRKAKSTLDSKKE